MIRFHLALQNAVLRKYLQNNSQTIQHIKYFLYHRVCSRLRLPNSTLHNNFGILYISNARTCLERHQKLFIKFEGSDNPNICKMCDSNQLTNSISFFFLQMIACILLNYRTFYHLHKINPFQIPFLLCNFFSSVTILT